MIQVFFFYLLGRTAYSSSQANKLVFSWVELRSPPSGNLAPNIFVQIQEQVYIHICQTNRTIGENMPDCIRNTPTEPGVKMP